MTDYWRPGFPSEYKHKIEQFLEKNPEVPFDDPRDFIKFCTDSKIMDVETREMNVKQEQKQILENLKKELDL